MLQDHREFVVLGVEAQGAAGVLGIFKEPGQRFHPVQLIQIALTGGIGSFLQPGDAGLIAVPDPDLGLADLQFDIPGVVVSVFLGRDGAGDPVEDVVLTYQVDGKKGRSSPITDIFGDKYVVFLGDKIEDTHQDLPQCGLARGVGSHNDVDLLISEVGTILQMLLPNVGVHDLLGIGQVHLEVLKCEKVVQPDIQNNHSIPPN